MSWYVLCLQEVGNWGFEEHCYVHGLGIAAQCETIEEALWLVVLRSLVVVVVRGVVRGVRILDIQTSLAICTSGLPLNIWTSGLLAIWTSDHFDLWPFRLLAIRTSSHLGLWPSRLMVIWPSRPLAIQTSHYLDPYPSGLLTIQTSGHSDFWPFWFLDFCRDIFGLTSSLCSTDFSPLHKASAQKPFFCILLSKGHGKGTDESLLLHTVD